jgi:type VI secretion system secreted protein VgrG
VAGLPHAAVSPEKAGAFQNMSYTQDDRFIAINTPLGKDVLLLEGFRGQEAISRLFHFDVDLLSENHDIEFKDIIGQRVAIRITEYSGSPRYINGFVSRFSQGGYDPAFAHYRMEVVPWLWFLTRHADCRIFQNKTIPQIIEQVFKDRGFTDYRSSLTETYEEREYCVQYRETDFQFVSRLMEEYGIFYFFEHEENKHTLVLADSATACKNCPDGSVVRYNLAGGGLDVDDMVDQFNLTLDLRSGKYSMTDYNFETPSANLMANDPTVMEYAGNSKLEIYDYPGKYQTQSEGKSLAKVRMQEEEAAIKIGRGKGDCRTFVTGYKFELQDHPAQSMNGSYVLTEMLHEASVGGGYTTGDLGAGTYSNSFSCIPADVPFRPPRITPKPLISGPQTAVVVGKSGEEIWVDKYGRVMVQFFWDRVGKKDENSSCWIRVSQAWAGKNWGAMWIPRIGQEVIVEFLEGDPDRPIITGRVYNADQEVPYQLPEHGTRSTLLSRSSKGGATANFNEIRFEDKKGSEQIFINAEKDMDLRVEQESREFVGASRHLIVGSDQKESVGGSLHSKVGKGFNQKVGDGVSLDVGTALNQKTGTTFAHEAGTDIHLKAGMNVVIEAGVELTIKAGSAFVNLGPAGVAISGSMVLINSGGAAGSGPGANTQSPEAPDEADDGSKGTKLGGGAGASSSPASSGGGWTKNESGSSGGGWTKNDSGGSGGGSDWTKNV